MSSGLHANAAGGSIHPQAVAAVEQVRLMEIKERELLDELEDLKDRYANDMQNALNSVVVNEEEIVSKANRMVSASKSNLKRIVVRWKQWGVRCKLLLWKQRQVDWTNACRRHGSYWLLHSYQRSLEQIDSTRLEVGMLCFNQHRQRSKIERMRVEKQQQIQQQIQQQHQAERRSECLEKLLFRTKQQLTEAREQNALLEATGSWRGWLCHKREQKRIWSTWAASRQRNSLNLWRKRCRECLLQEFHILSGHSDQLASNHWRREQLAGVLELFQQRLHNSPGEREQWTHQLRFDQNHKEAEWRYMQLRVLFRALDYDSSGCAPGRLLKELGHAVAVRERKCGWNWSKHSNVLETMAPWHPEVTEEVFIQFFGAALPMRPSHFDKLIQSFFDQVKSLAPDPTLLKPPASPRSNVEAKNVEAIFRAKRPKRGSKAAAEVDSGAAFHPSSKLPLSCRVSRPKQLKQSSIRRQTNEISGSLAMDWQHHSPIWTRRVWAYRLWYSNTVGREKLIQRTNETLQSSMQNRRRGLMRRAFSFFKCAASDGQCEISNLKIAKKSFRKCQQRATLRLWWGQMSKLRRESGNLLKARKHRGRKEAGEVSDGLRLWVDTYEMLCKAAELVRAFERSKKMILQDSVFFQWLEFSRASKSGGIGMLRGRRSYRSKSIKQSLHLWNMQAHIGAKLLRSGQKARHFRMRNLASRSICWWRSRSKSHRVGCNSSHKALDFRDYMLRLFGLDRLRSQSSRRQALQLQLKTCDLEYRKRTLLRLLSRWRYLSRAVSTMREQSRSRHANFSQKLLLSKKLRWCRFWRMWSLQYKKVNNSERWARRQMIESPKRAALDDWRLLSQKKNAAAVRNSFINRMAKHIRKLRAANWFNIWKADTATTRSREARAVCAGIWVRFNIQREGAEGLRRLHEWRRWRQRRVQLFRIGSAIRRHQIHLYQCRGFISWRNTTNVYLRKQVLDLHLNGVRAKTQELEKHKINMMLPERDGQIFELSQRLIASQELVQLFEQRLEMQQQLFHGELQEREREKQEMIKKYETIQLDSKQWQQKELLDRDHHFENRRAEHENQQHDQWRHNRFPERSHGPTRWQGTQNGNGSSQGTVQSDDSSTTHQIGSPKSTSSLLRSHKPHRRTPQHAPPPSPLGGHAQTIDVQHKPQPHTLDDTRKSHPGKSHPAANSPVAVNSPLRSSHGHSSLGSYTGHPTNYAPNTPSNNNGPSVHVTPSQSDKSPLSFVSRSDLESKQSPGTANHKQEYKSIPTDGMGQFPMVIGMPMGQIPLIDDQHKQSTQVKEQIDEMARLRNKILSHLE